MTTGPGDLARAKDWHWWRLGELLRSIERDRGWEGRYRTIGDWLTDASVQLGKSPNQLRRYGTSLTFLEQLASEKRLPSVALGTQIPEVTVDALSRLNRIAPTAVDRLLQNIPASVPSYRTVLDELRKQSLADPTRLGPRERAKRLPLMFEMHCLAELEKKPRLLSRDHVSLIRPNRLPYGVSIDALLPAASWEWCDGCEFRTLSHPAQTTSTIREVAWSARFFRFLWLWIAVEDHRMQSALELCDVAQLDNVGVVTASTSVSIRREPRVESPHTVAREAFIQVARKTYDSPNLIRAF